MRRVINQEKSQFLRFKQTKLRMHHETELRSLPTKKISLIEKGYDYQKIPNQSSYRLPLLSYYPVAIHYCQHKHYYNQSKFRIDFLIKLLGLNRHLAIPVMNPHMQLPRFPIWTKGWSLPLPSVWLMTPEI